MRNQSDLQSRQQNVIYLIDFIDQYCFRSFICIDFGAAKLASLQEMEWVINVAIELESVDDDNGAGQVHEGGSRKNSLRAFLPSARPHLIEMIITYFNNGHSNRSSSWMDSTWRRRRRLRSSTISRVHMYGWMAHIASEMPTGRRPVNRYCVAAVLLRC